MLTYAKQFEPMSRQMIGALISSSRTMSLDFVTLLLTH